MNDSFGGGCTGQDDPAGEDEEFGSAEVRITGHIHISLFPILLCWLRELAGLTAADEPIVEAKELAEDKVPVDVADVDDLIVDELLWEIADAKVSEEDVVPLDAADKGVSHVLGEEATEKRFVAGLIIEVRQLSLEFRFLASSMDMACTWSM